MVPLDPSRVGEPHQLVQVPADAAHRTQRLGKQGGMAGIESPGGHTGAEGGVTDQFGNRKTSRCGDAFHSREFRVCSPNPDDPGAHASLPSTGPTQGPRGFTGEFAPPDQRRVWAHAIAGSFPLCCLTK